MQETAKKYFKYLIILAIVIIAAAVLISKCGGKVKEVRTEKKEDKRLVHIQDKLDSSFKAGNDLMKRVNKKALKDSLALIESKRVIKMLNWKLEKARQPVQALIDSIPELDRFVDLGDSIRFEQDTLINTLVNQKAEMWRNFNNLLSIEQSKTALEHEKGLILTEQRDRYRKKADKRFIIGPYVGIDYRLRPSIGVSVQYRLLRF